MRQVVGSGGCAGVGDGNAIKWGCDDHCTTINVIKFINFFLKNIKVEKNNGDPFHGVDFH